MRDAEIDASKNVAPAELRLGGGFGHADYMLAEGSTVANLRSATPDAEAKYHRVVAEHRSERKNGSTRVNLT